MAARLTEEELELEFLRFFYDAAGEAFGPADADIYYMIKEDFQVETGYALPEGYER